MGGGAIIHPPCKLCSLTQMVREKEEYMDDNERNEVENTIKDLAEKWGFNTIMNVLINVGSDNIKRKEGINHD